MMKTNMYGSSFSLPLLSVAISILITFSASVFGQGVVIVHPSNGNSLDKKLISKIFLGKKKTYPNGNEAIPVDLKGGNLGREAFVQNVLKKNNQQIKAYWSQLLFTGKGRPPKEVDTSNAVKRLVAENPSVIGYIDAGSSDDSVKVVLQY